MPSLLESLKTLLRAGPRDAPALCQALGISQPTFSRLWKQPGAGIVRIGQARASRYALLRPLGQLGTTLPLFRVGQGGGTDAYGALTMLYPHWFLFAPHDGGRPELIEGLPYFLQDLRPQGFLGRLAPRLHPELNLPQDILLWSDDDVLLWAARRGEDAAGNLIVGNESLARFLRAESAPTVGEASRDAAYPALAERANLGTVDAGSSAAGEQPKFTACVARRDGSSEHVIVKFSPPVDTSNGRRWADLLIAEHLALCTLQDHGIAACGTQIVAAGQRVFVEAIRYDRQGSRGRSPVATLAALDGITGAADRNWTACAELLAEQARLGEIDTRAVATLDVFGFLIGNNDRHHGNLAFFWSDDGTLALAPVYDMLPMLYRPNAQGEIIARQVDLSPLDRLDLRFLPQAHGMACDFWQRVVDDERISADFRRIASNHAAAIEAIR